jgi:hypothetical protein
MSLGLMDNIFKKMASLFQDKKQEDGTIVLSSVRQFVRNVLTLVTEELNEFIKNINQNTDEQDMASMAKLMVMPEGIALIRDILDMAINRMKIVFKDS